MTALAVAVAAAAIFLWHHGGEERDMTPAAALAVPRSSDAPGEPGMTAPDRAESPRMAKLNVTVLRAGVGPPILVPGDVAWQVSPTMPLSPPRLCGEGVPRRSHDGRTTLEVAARSWTWVEVRGTLSVEMSVTAYRLVPPFEGEYDLSVTLERAGHALHVFVWNSELDGPAGSVLVRLFGRDLRGQPIAAGEREVVTDASGYALADGLAPGIWIARVPGADLRDSAPQTGRIVMPPGAIGSEAVMTLALGEKRESVVIRARCPELGRGTLPPRLVLERRSDRRGELYPVGDALASGVRDYPVDVPAGRYRIQVLPLGEFVHFGPEIDVTEGTSKRVEIELIRNAVETEVELHGIPVHRLPVTVCPEDPDALQQDTPELAFCGPYRWQKLAMRVHLPRAAKRLLVFGNGTCWMNATPLDLGQRMIVRVREATRLEVQQPFAVDRRPAPTTWIVRDMDGTQHELVPWKRLVPIEGRMEPRLVARLVVPRGRVVLESVANGVTRHDERVLRLAFETMELPR